MAMRFALWSALQVQLESVLVSAARTLSAVIAQDRRFLQPVSCNEPTLFDLATDTDVFAKTDLLAEAPTSARSRYYASRAYLCLAQPDTPA